MNEFKIANRLIGENYEPVVIAELGINHGGSIDLAIHMVDEAVSAGAEIIKHQTHIIEDEMSEEAKQVIPGNADVSIYEIMKHCALDYEEEKRLMDYVHSVGAIFISTPFSRKAADRLAEFGVPAYKIGSGECNNYPLIRHIARQAKPVIVSTGMNDIESIRPTVQILRDAKVPFALLHCTNVYPTPLHLVRLQAMTQLKNAFPDAVIGLSDHTTSNFACLGAVALGASILERHFTDSKTREGPDIVCSMDPDDLRNLIDGSIAIHRALRGEKTAVKEELPTIAFAFASVVSTKKILAGEVLCANNIWVKRPGGGDFSASEYEGLFGSVALEDIEANVQLKKNQLRN